MPLHIRRRGNIWYARGTVRVGRQTVEVDEFSTGCRARIEALTVTANREAEIRGDLLDGAGGRARRLTIADCLLAYLGRPGGVTLYDQDRVHDFNERIGGRALAEAPQAWAEWLRGRGAGMAPATAARWRAILQAALKLGAEQHGVPKPLLPTVRQPTGETPRFLIRSEQDRLLGAYT